jgi:hypothetical protein
MRDKQIADQIFLMRVWQVYMLVMYGLHYILGISAVFLAVTVASKPFGWLGWAKDDERCAMLAWILAAITGVVSFIMPERTGDRYQRAFRVLNVEVTRFRSDETYTVNHVLQAYERGEDIIHAKRATE